MTLVAFDGDTVEEFLNWKSLAYEPDIEWEIYAFEPNPNFDYSRFVHHKNVEFIQKAAWTEDGQAEFAVDPSPDSPMGSTLMPEKASHWNIGEKITVETIDFSKWLEQFRGDHVILKVDIEGSEYPVLTKMVEDGTDDIAHLTMVEWHEHKMPNYKSNRDWIMENYRGKLVSWH